MSLEDSDLYEMLMESRRECEARMHAVREQVSKFTGGSFFEKGIVDRSNPANYYYGYVVNAASRNLAAVPRVRLSSGLDDPPPEVANLEVGVNGWLVDTHYERLREQFLVDMCFGMCVSMVSQEARLGYEQFDDPLQTPKMRRVPPECFGYDVMAQSADDTEFQYHLSILKKERLIQRAKSEDGWDMDALEGLVEEDGVPQARNNKTGIRRHEIVLFNVFLPFEENEDGSLGVLRTMGWSAPNKDVAKGKAQRVRKDRKYYGPRSGPYAIGGFLKVPGVVYPLSALVANEAHFRSLNAQARANDLAAQTHKSFTIVDSMNPEGRAAVINVEHGEVLGLPNFDKTRMETVEQGGVSQYGIEREEFLRIRADREIGTSDENRGLAARGGTATQSVIASNAASRYDSLFDAKFQQFEAAGIANVAWFLNDDSRSFVRSGGTPYFGGEENADGTHDGLEMAIEQGAISQEEYELAEGQESPKARFDDLQIRVESVRSDDRAMQEFQLMSNFLLQTLPALPMMPYAETKPWFDAAAETFRRPELRRIVNYEALGAFVEQQAEAEAEPTAPRTIPAPKPTQQKVSENKPTTQPKAVKKS